MKNSILIIMLSLAAFSCTERKAGKENNMTRNAIVNAAPAIDAYAFKTADGWGYSILINGKLFIKQPYIPAIEGVKSFATQADAERTAQLIVEKLRANQRPVIQKEELQKLHII